MQEHFSSQWAYFDLKESALLATKGTDSLILLDNCPFKNIAC